MSSWLRHSAAVQVRRARSGPGLWPGPCRQACWVGRGSGAQGWVPKILSAKRLERIFGALDAGGADLDNARRSGPVAVTFRTAIGASDARVTAGSCSCGAASGRDGGDRLRPVPGTPCAAARRAVGLPPEGRGESCRPAMARPQRPCRSSPVPGRSTLPPVARASSRSRFRP
jgi:hypothetical protein